MSLPVQEVTKLINLYRARPDLFTDEQIEELDNQANALEIKFKPLEQQADVRKMAKQFVSGFGSGFTTLPMGDHPRTTYESIAHSLGHLAGFAPSILTAPVSLFTKGLMKVGAKGLATSINKKAIPALHKLGELSLPMIGSRYSKRAIDKGLSASKLDAFEFFKKGSASRQIVEEAIGLGSASVVSGVWQGPDTYMNTFVHGAIAGGAFGGIGNFVRLDKMFKHGNPEQVKSAENMLKMSIGASITGIPSTLRKDPIEMQIYEYLLGGFFGYSSRPAFEAERGKFITNTMYSNTPEYVLNPTKHRDFHTYSKKVRESLIESANESSVNWLKANRHPDVVDAMIYNQAMLRHGDKKGYEPTEADLYKEYRILAFNEYQKDRKHIKFEEAHKDSYNKDSKMDSNDPSYHYNNRTIDLSRSIFDSLPDSSGYKHVMDVAKDMEIYLDKYRESKNPSVNEFIRDIKNLNIPESSFKKIENRLKVHFHEYMKIPQDATIADFTGDGLTFVRSKEMDGVRLGQYYFNLPIDKLDPLFVSGEGRSFEVLNYIRTKDGFEKPFESTIDYSEGQAKVVSNMSNKRIKELNDTLYSQGKYIFSGNKHKKQLIIANIINDGHTIGDIINALSKGEMPKAEILKEFQNQKSKSQDPNFDAKWLSNALYDAIYNRLYQIGSGNLSEIHRLTRDSYGKNVVDYNKRIQGLMDKGVQQHPDYYGKKTFKYAIINDINTSGKSDTDGGLMVEHSVFDKGSSAMGFSKKIGHYKPTILHRGDKGLLFVKAAGQRASQAWQDYMVENGLDFIVFESSAKRSGDIPITKVEYKDGKYQGEVFPQEMNVESLRINSSTYENPYKQIGNIRIPMQLGGQLSVLQNGEAPQLYFDTIIKKSISGTKTAQEMVAKNLPDTGLVKELKKFNIDELPVDFVYKILISPEHYESAKHIRKMIQKIESEGGLDIREEYFGEEIFRDYHSQNKDLARYADGQFAPNTFLKHLSRTNNGAIRKYILSRYINPVWRTSSKAWLKTYTPDMLPYGTVKGKKGVERRLDEGEIYLDVEHKNMPVEFRGKETTLGKLWDQYIRADKNKQDLTDYHDAFELAVIRVPADSVSGTRILQFKGFTDQKGAGALTHHKDNKYLGGADKDSDSVFIIQNMDKRLRKEIGKQKDERSHWDKDPNLKKQLEAMFGIKEQNIHLMSKFDPDQRLLVAQRAIEGQNGLGYGLSGKMQMQEWADVIHKNGGKFKFSITKDTKNEKNVKFSGEIRLKDKKAQEKFRDLGVIVVNASADASSNPFMKPYVQHRDILFNAMFEGELFINGKKSTLDFSAVRNHLPFGKYGNFLNAIKPNGKISENKQRLKPDWENTQDFIGKYDFESGSSVFFLIGRDMKAKGLNQRLIPSKLIFLSPSGKDITTNLKLSYRTRDANAPESVGSKIINSIFGEISKNSKGNMLAIERVGRNLNEKINDHAINIVSEMAGKELGKITTYELLTEQANLLAKEVGTTRAKELMRDAILNALRIKTKSHALSDNKSTTPMIYRDFDSSLKSLKIRLITNGALAKEKYDGTILARAVDYIMLSPFLGKINKRGFFDINYSKASYASKDVYETSFKNFFNRMEDVYNRSVTSVKENKDFIFNEPKTYQEAIDPVDKARIIATSLHRKTKDEYDVKSLALSPEHLKAIEEFENHLKKNPQIAENFNDRFTEWVSRIEGEARDTTTMTMQDIYAMNKFFNDAYKKKISDVELWDWYRDPRTVDEKMAKHDAQVFEGIIMPVRTSKGIVRRKITKVMSPLGAIREYFKKIERETVAEIERVVERNTESFSWRKTQSKEDIAMLMDIIINKREGVDLTPEMEAWMNKTFTHKGSKMSGAKMIDTANRQMTDFFKRIGEEWLYTNEKTMNRLFKYDNEGRFIPKFFLKEVITTSDYNKPSPKIGLEALLRYDYERKLELKLIQEGITSAKKRKLWRENYRKKHKLIGIGGKGKDWVESYVPHINIGYNKKAMREFSEYVESKAQLAYEQALRDGKTEQQAKDIAENQRLYWQFYREGSIRESAGYEKSVLDSEVGGERPDIALSRKHKDMVGFDRRETLFDDYKKQIIRSYYRNLIAIQGNHQIDQMLKRNSFGDFSKVQKKKYGDLYNNQTEVWADYLKLYLRDILGQPTTFNERILKSIDKGDPLKLKKSMYYQTSDKRMVDAITRYIKSFEKKGLEVPIFKNMPKNKDGKYTDSKGNLTQPQKEYLTRKIHDMARLEARYELLTLLANTGVFAGNIYGGATMTIASGGLKNFVRSKSDKQVTKHLLTDEGGNYVLKLKSGTPVTNRKEFHKWLTEKGIIDTYIQNELDYNPDFRDSLAKYGTNGKQFISQLKKILRENPEARNESIRELAQRYGITDKVLQAGGWLMQKSERINRLDAFTTHALQAREKYGLYAKEINMSDPYLFEMGLKGIENTQFLYHSAFRPAFMRTSTGKVLTRFKLFAFQSVRTRHEFAKYAKYYGYKKGTASYERAKDLFLIDMFTMALGSIFMFSLFDTALPPPWDWLQDTSDLLLGDKKERDKAFFGMYPRPIAPLQVATPPIARVPQAFIQLINGDYERFADYTIHTLYPFGRIVRQVDKTFDEPYGTTLGRGIRQFTRLPADRLVYKIKASKRDEDRLERIEELL